MAQTVTNIFFSSELYSPESVKLAAYVFEGRFAVKLAVTPAGTAAAVKAGPEQAGAFANEALNQQCRADLAAVNGRLAGIIVTRTLLSAAGGAAEAG